MVFENIIDTREWQTDPVDRIARPLKGSGEMHACDHCGAMHEIHVIVRDGETLMNIGTSCVQKVAPYIGHRCTSGYLKWVRRMRSIYGEQWKPK